MTNEEAIAVLEEQSNFFRGFQHYFESKSVEISAEKLNAPKLAAERYRKLADAFDAGISALQSVGKDITVPTKDDHFPDLTKMVPLTIEELRKMDGQPVLLVFDFELDPMTALVEYAEAADCIILTNNLGGRSEFYSDEELKESGIKVYAYPPAHIDREAWEPCLTCNTCASCKYSIDSAFRTNSKCFDCEHRSNYEARKFCPDCGRPLTEEAWAELEKRLRG